MLVLFGSTSQPGLSTRGCRLAGRHVDCLIFGPDLLASFMFEASGKEFEVVDVGNLLSLPLREERKTTRASFQAKDCATPPIGPKEKLQNGKDACQEGFGRHCGGLQFDSSVGSTGIANSTPLWYLQTCEGGMGLLGRRF